MFNDISVTKLTKEQSRQCEGEITKNQVKVLWIVTKHPEMMVLPVIFMKRFGLKSKPIVIIL